MTRPRSDDTPPLRPAAAPEARTLSYIAGHRKRLRERFADGPEVMQDYELLEMILFRSQKRGDVKPLAWRLMNRFGDLNRVLAATPPQLTEVDGVGPAILHDLKLIEAVAHRMARVRVIARPVLSDRNSLLDYCRTRMAHRETEQLRVFYLDRKNVLITDEVSAEGTVDHAPAYPREILKRALALNASALILVHNHPSGDPTPSEADIALTRQINAVAGALGLTLHDHFVIGKSVEVSLRDKGLF